VAAAAEKTFQQESGNFRFILIFVDFRFKVTGFPVSGDRISGLWSSGGRIHKTSFSSQLTNWLNKLVLHYIMLRMLVRDKHSSVMEPTVKNHLHYGDYRSKLVHFHSKKYLQCLKKP
jgi:hypothetical protein